MKTSDLEITFDNLCAAVDRLITDPTTPDAKEILYHRVALRKQLRMFELCGRCEHPLISEHHAKMCTPVAPPQGWVSRKIEIERELAELNKKYPHHRALIDLAGQWCIAHQWKSPLESLFQFAAEFSHNCTDENCPGGLIGRKNHNVGGQGWVSVAERLPEEEVPVHGLFRTPMNSYAMGILMRVSSRDDDGGGWHWAVLTDNFIDLPPDITEANFDSDDYDITHWMPLPTPPPALKDLEEQK